MRRSCLSKIPWSVLTAGPTHEHNNKPITYAGQDANGDNYPDGCDGYYCYRNVNFGYYGFDNIGQPR